MKQLIWGGTDYRIYNRAHALKITRRRIITPFKERFIALNLKAASLMALTKTAL